MHNVTLNVKKKNTHKLSMYIYIYMDVNTKKKIWKFPAVRLWEKGFQLGRGAEVTPHLLLNASKETLSYLNVSSYEFIFLSLVAQTVKNLPVTQKTYVWSLGREDALETGMATHFSIFAWRIPRTEEPGGLQSVGLPRVRHDWATNTTQQTLACKIL